MLTITIFAAGLVCLAGVLGLRLGRAQAQVSTVAAQASSDEPDERGITLQTLIVTAVLVLMAVAAGVVIVAITNNAAEDLEQSAPGLDARCESVEVFDPIQAAQGKIYRPDSNDLIEGSVVGCRPICFTTASRSHDAGSDTVYDLTGDDFTGADVVVPVDGLYDKAASDPSRTDVAHWLVAPSDTVKFDAATKRCYTETDSNGVPVENSAYFHKA